MRNFGFLGGLLAGYLLFTDEGKKLTKSVIESLDKASNTVVEKGKEIIKEGLPETSKILGGEKNV